MCDMDYGDGFEGGEGIDGGDSSPSLSEYNDMIDNTEDIAELTSIRDALERGEYAESNSLSELTDVDAEYEGDENVPVSLEGIANDEVINVDLLEETGEKSLGEYPAPEIEEETEETQHLSDVHDVLTEVYGIPEGSPELEAMMQNEAAGYEELHGEASDFNPEETNEADGFEENTLEDSEETEEQHLSDVHDMLTEVYGVPEDSPELEAMMQNEAAGYEELYGEASDQVTEETNETEAGGENTLEGSEDTEEQHLSDVHDMLTEVYGVPEGSPELEAMMQNEAAGYEELHEETPNIGLEAADENVVMEAPFQEIEQPIENTTISDTDDMHPEIMEPSEERIEGEMNENEGAGIEDEPLTDVSEDLNIDYNEIYAGFSAEELEQGFEEINIDNDRERLDSTLNDFQQESWEQLSLEEQKGSMSSLADYVIETIGFDNPPHIEYYNNPRNGDYGGYNSATNTLRVNEYMLEDSEEAADTIAHELWHAHQRECANDPKSVRDFQYQYNFENYIRPEMGHEAYENQLIEAEARAFARQFKGRIRELRG